MNYIKRMKKEAKEKDAQIEALEKGLSGILAYIGSDKFRTGELQGYVNVIDIELRVRETLDSALVAKEEASDEFFAEEEARKADIEEEFLGDHGDEYRGSW
jgi:hypothetical protein